MNLEKKPVRPEKNRKKPKDAEKSRKKHYLPGRFSGTAVPVLRGFALSKLYLR